MLDAGARYTRRTTHAHRTQRNKINKLFGGCHLSWPGAPGPNMKSQICQTLSISLTWTLDTCLAALSQSIHASHEIIFRFSTHHARAHIPTGQWSSGDIRCRPQNVVRRPHVQIENVFPEAELRILECLRDSRACVCLQSESRAYLTVAPERVAVSRHMRCKANSK